MHRDASRQKRLSVSLDGEVSVIFRIGCRAADREDNEDESEKE